MKYSVLVCIIILMFCANSQHSIAQSTFNLYARMAGNLQLWDGSNTDVWGFVDEFGETAALPGPTIIVREGELVTLNVTNQSPLAHTVHLHGLDVDQMNDGVPQTSFEIPGMMGTGTYTFIAPHAGTYMYHCHVESVVHFQMGMYGAIIVTPSDGSQTAWTGGPAYDKEYLWMSSEVDVNWHESPPSGKDVPLYHPQYFLVNGKSKQQLSAADVAIEAVKEDVVLIRIANAGYGVHKYCFPSQLNATVVSSDGRPLPIFDQRDTVEIFPGERYMVVLDPDSSFNGIVNVAYFDMYDDDMLFNNEIPVKFDEATNTSAVNINFQVRVSPNPASTLLRVAVTPDPNSLKRLSVYDLNGIRLLTQSFNSSSIELDTKGLPAGQYILQIRNEFSVKSVPIFLTN
jgi:hypothetical protein